MMPTLSYMGRVREIVTEATGDPECWSTHDLRVVALVDEMSDEIERLRLYERYANRDIRYQVERALMYRDENGKFPFED